MCLSTILQGNYVFALSTICLRIVARSLASKASKISFSNLGLEEELIIIFLYIFSIQISH